MKKIVPLLVVCCFVLLGCSRAERTKKKCYGGLRQLDAGCEAWAISYKHRTGQPLDRDGVVDFIHEDSVRCPATGKPYILSVVGSNPVCQTHGDLLSGPEIFPEM